MIYIWSLSSEEYLNPERSLRGEADADGGINQYEIGQVSSIFTFTGQDCSNLYRSCCYLDCYK
jgi:hypothetical protein